MWSIISLFLIAHQIFILNQVKKFILDMVRISLSYLHKQSFLCDKIPHQHSLMGNIYELYYFYPTCIASGFIYELNYLYPAPSASGNHLLLKLVYMVRMNLSTYFSNCLNFSVLSLSSYFSNPYVLIRHPPSCFSKSIKR